jgi:hypothetical protein
MEDDEIRIQVRRGTSTEWSNVNPILAVGEPGFDTSNGVLKIGDGAAAWNTLSGVSGSAQNPTANTLNHAGGTENNWLPSIEADTIRFTPQSELTITGVDTAYGKTSFRLVNEGPAAIILVHASVNSLVNNRLYNAFGGDMKIYRGDTVTFIYDVSISKWLITGSGQAIKMIELTQFEYDNQSSYDPNTLYIITG